MIGNRVSFRFVSFRVRSKKESSSNNNNEDRVRFLDLQYLKVVIRKFYFVEISLIVRNI